MARSLGKRSLQIIRIICNIILPIHKEEFRKFIPICGMLMLIVFVSNLLRATKDALLIPEMGAEIISTLELWGILPTAILFTLSYTKLANWVSRENLFYVLVGSFIIFFAIYNFELYPNKDYYQPLLQEHLIWFKHRYPNLAISLKFPLMMLDKWVLSLFGILAEIWCSVMLTFAFWQFVNYITPMHQAKRFYSLFNVIGQFGMVASGLFAQYSTRLYKVGPDQSIAWDDTLNVIITTTIAACSLLLLLYWYINKYILTAELFEQDKITKTSGQKLKLSLFESLKYIFTSKYIGLIACLVICYGVSINITESIWKNQVKIAFPNSNEYLNFMGQFYFWAGVLTIIGPILSVNLIKYFGWFAGAIITPFIMIITGTLFFLFMIVNNHFDSSFILFGMTSLMLSVLLGAIQNSSSKAMKYSAFDATKEMAYIPLDNELKTKGKAAIDIVGIRIGKSGGAFIQQFLFGFTGVGLSLLTYELFFIFIIIMFIWWISVVSLNKEFKNLTSE